MTSFRQPGNPVIVVDSNAVAALPRKMVVAAGYAGQMICLYAPTAHSVAIPLTRPINQIGESELTAIVEAETDRFGVRINPKLAVSLRDYVCESQKG